MKKNLSSEKKRAFTGLLLIFTIVGMTYISIAMNFNNNQVKSRGNTLKTSSAPNLFTGIESALNITDTGVLFEENQAVSISNQESTNLTYFLDDVHDWRASEIIGS